jgi:alkanesulfonate monooxygenase SsuD/methylene tetrahydromethanopterin reductase-like flavin-dependent oxidoreductase (luciferase family)
MPGPERSRAIRRGVGWDGVFLADHLIFPPPSTIGGSVEADERWDFPDPWITLAAIASRTERIRLGSWITPVARRQPWQLARDLATLDRLSRGRVILGAGLGRRLGANQLATST